MSKCDKCQKHLPILHRLAETLNSVTSPGPFAQWGMDIVGPFPTAAAQKKFLLVATDYFSKFVWKNIVCRFGIPQAIVTDNDPQFDSSAFKATNKTLLSALKKRLEKAKAKWVEELPGVLWAYRTTPGRPIGNTPFALAYGTNVVIPTEVGMPIARTAVQGQRNEDDELARHLDWADEVREAASIRMAAYQQKVAAYYNRRCDLRFSRKGHWCLEKSLKTWLRKEPENFRPIGKVLICRRASLAPANEKAPCAIVVHIKEKLCKGSIFIPPFLTDPDRRYKRGHYGILTKKCHLTPLGCITSEFYSVDVPPHLDISYPDPTDVLPSPDISHPADAGWERRTTQLSGQIDNSTTLTTKSPELSLIFNARHARQDIPKSYQSA
ncbi:hypothetical protein AAG906_005958 [Vitis piasezkii]